MPSFTVETAGLIAGAALVARTGVDLGGAHAGLTGSAGALDGTPAEFAFADFVGSAQTTLASLHDAAAGLSRALNMAAMAYGLADSSAAQSLTPGG
jgi:excreted virulence factor EspC (type VII ESX diderm)